jgi:hypothetical protein
MSAKVTVIIYILICFEVGVLLAILPWTSYWDENFFLYFLMDRLRAPRLAAFLQSGYARGAVTGLGVLNILAGIRDILKFRESVNAITALDAPSAEASKPATLDSTVSSPITLSDHQPPNAPPGD